MKTFLPWPVACLELVAVNEPPRAGLQQGPPEHADVVLAAVGGVGVVPKLLGTTELCLTGRYQAYKQELVLFFFR